MHHALYQSLFSKKKQSVQRSRIAATNVMMLLRLDFRKSFLARSLIACRSASLNDLGAGSGPL
jgi:hypothetical protein